MQNSILYRKLVGAIGRWRPPDKRVIKGGRLLPDVIHLEDFFFPQCVTHFQANVPSSVHVDGRRSIFSYLKHCMVHYIDSIK